MPAVASIIEYMNDDDIAYDGYHIHRGRPDVS